MEQSRPELIEVAVLQIAQPFYPNSLGIPPEERERIKSIVQDYANYWLGKHLATPAMQGTELRKAVEAMLPLVAELSETVIGKRLFSQLKPAYKNVVAALTQGETPHE